MGAGLRSSLPQPADSVTHDVDLSMLSPQARMLKRGAMVCAKEKGSERVRAAVHRGRLHLPSRHQFGTSRVYDADVTL